METKYEEIHTIITIMIFSSKINIRTWGQPFWFKRKYLNNFLNYHRDYTDNHGRQRIDPVDFSDPWVFLSRKQQVKVFTDPVKISLHLRDGLEHSLGQTFMVPRGYSLISQVNCSSSATALLTFVVLNKSKYADSSGQHFMTKYLQNWWHSHQPHCTCV